MVKVILNYENGIEYKPNEIWLNRKNKIKTPYEKETCEIWMSPLTM